MITFCLTLMFIIVVTGIVLDLLNKEHKIKDIAVVQFDERKFDPQLEEKIWAIADWYEFQNSANAEFEIQDLKEHYKIVLELH